MQVVAVNYGLETLLLDDGSVITITNWMDENGDDCDKESAVACVAGPCADGLWYNATLNEFSANALN